MPGPYAEIFPFPAVQSSQVTTAATTQGKRHAEISDHGADLDYTQKIHLTLLFI